MFVDACCFVLKLERLFKKKTWVNVGGDGKLGSLSLVRLRRDSRDRGFPSMLTPNVKLTATFLFNAAQWEQLTFNALGVHFSRQEWLLDGERSRRLSGVHFRSDLFHKWFSLSCAELGAQTLSASSSIKKKIVEVTHGVLNTTNGLPVKLALLIAVKRAHRCFSAWWEMAHISRVHTWICAFFYFNVGAHGSSVRVCCAHQLQRLWTVLFG